MQSPRFAASNGLHSLSARGPFDHLGGGVEQDQDDGGEHYYHHGQTTWSQNWPNNSGHITVGSRSLRSTAPAIVAAFGTKDDSGSMKNTTLASPPGRCRPTISRARPMLFARTASLQRVTSNTTLLGSLFDIPLSASDYVAYYLL